MEQPGCSGCWTEVIVRLIGPIVSSGWGTPLRHVGNAHKRLAAVGERSQHMVTPKKCELSIDQKVWCGTSER